jgi:hypothetical protein
LRRLSVEGLRPWKGTAPQGGCLQEAGEIAGWTALTRRQGILSNTFECWKLSLNMQMSCVMDQELKELLARIEASKLEIDRMAAKAHEMVIESKKIIDQVKGWKSAEAKRAAKKKPK